MSRRRTRAVLGLLALTLAACGQERETRARATRGEPADVTTSTALPATEMAVTTTSAPVESAPAGSGWAAPASTVVPVHSMPPTTAPPRPAPTTTTTTTTPPPPLPVEGSGVRGRITAGPTCPVERPDQPCPPRPVVADVEAISNASGQRAGATRSDADGRYAIALAPGEYDVNVKTESHWPSCPSVHVSVRAGEVATADFDCDTGIR